MSSRLFHCEDHRVLCQHIRNYPRATASSQEEELQLAVKQYTPISNATARDGDLTIIAVHGNGFTRELYEPLWDDLLELSQRSGTFRIRSIWFADVANQGVSGLLNESKLGNDPSWFDHARDLLQMVNHFRRQMPLPLVGFGHSMGATALLHLSLLHPRLFHAMIVVDPVLAPRPSPGGRNMAVAYLSTVKKDTWLSRGAADESFRKIPFYKHWDTRVLDLFLEHCLTDVSDSPSGVATRKKNSTNKPDERVKLTTSKHQEVFSLARPAYPNDPDQPLAEFVSTRLSHPDLAGYWSVGDVYRKPVAFYRPEATFIFTQLQNIRPQVLFISPTSSTVTMPRARAEVVAAIGQGQNGNGGLAEGGVKEVTLHGTDHFVPFVKPELVAEVSAPWLGEQVRRWQDEEAAAWQGWLNVPGEQKGRVDAAWQVWIKRQFGKFGETKQDVSKAKL